MATRDLGARAPLQGLGEISATTSLRVGVTSATDAEKRAKMYARIETPLPPPERASDKPDDERRRLSTDGSRCATSALFPSFHGRLSSTSYLRMPVPNPPLAAPMPCRATLNSGSMCGAFFRNFISVAKNIGTSIAFGSSSNSRGGKEIKYSIRAFRSATPKAYLSTFSYIHS